MHNSSRSLSGHGDHQHINISTSNFSCCSANSVGALHGNHQINQAIRQQTELTTGLKPCVERRCWFQRQVLEGRTQRIPVSRSQSTDTLAAVHKSAATFLSQRCICPACLLRVSAARLLAMFHHTNRTAAKQYGLLIVILQLSITTVLF